MARKKKKPSAPEELDLHGLRYDAVRPVVIEFIEGHWNSDKEIIIITGHSNNMKFITIDILKEYKLDFEEGDFWNKGYIRSWL